MGRTLPTTCKHGVIVDGGDFVDDERCPDCEREATARRSRIADLETQLAAMTAERDALINATHKLRHNFKLLLSGRPVSDVTETLAEAEAALAAAEEK